MFCSVVKFPFKLEIHVHIQKVIKLYTEHFAFYYIYSQKSTGKWCEGNVYTKHTINFFFGEKERI